ncbi:uncharacterized protein LOC110678758 isoform X2 [Aedes aegypti]|uniref:Uncharacterized protein n=1 Tax=Aedes aegypti TaxID=7159 RepID=A0A6I8U0H5_AEDAE|nr:uncharacterized protein LOC110678758 isoform X2 [Aedes aegypti]
MLEESETLAMFSLFLAAAETLEQQEAISPSTRQFEEVCIDKLQSGISTAYAESGNLDPLSTTTTNGFEQVFLQQANENVSVACDMTDPLFATNLNERSFHNHHEHRSDVGNLAGDHSASIRHNAIDKLPAILSIRYVEKSKSTKRHARSASTSEYSAYRNLSSFNNISQNRISNTTVPGVLLNNQKEISKRPSFCLDNVQTNACRGNSNLQNQSDEPWSSQPHPHANRVACKDVSHSSTTHKQVQLPNHYAQYGGPWENLSNPGANRVALADISNHSTTYKRGRLLSARDICGDHSASIRHNANDKLPAILSNRYVEKSESTKRHARSASTSEYSAYRNLSSFNNISQNRISNTTVPGVLLNNQKEISKRPSFCLDNVQTNACRGNSNHQNQSDEPWSSQPHPHANRVACKDVSHSSTTHKQVQLPNHYAQYGGPWENLSNPGANRVALADISNHSTTYKRGRLLSERDICDRSLNGMIVDEYPSFQRVQASTPISYASFALNLSLDENSTTDAPLDLVVVKPTTTISTDQIGSPMVLDLRKKNIAIDYKSPTTTRLMPEKLSLPKGHSKLTSNAISDSLGEPILNDEQMDAVDSGDYTDDDLDPEWMPDGDATLLNELSIYEYFEKYKNENLSDNDTDVENIDINVEVDSGEPQPNKKKADSRRKNQKLKEKGLSYKRADGTIVPARRVQSACNCKMRCSEKFSEPVRKELLLKLLELKQSGQNQFLSSHMSVINKLRPKVLISRRTWSRIYMLPGVGGKVKVCKHMFMSTFDIKERKIRVLADKLLLGGGIANDDKRMNNHSQKQLSPEHAEYIIKHIKSFPAEESHYGREKSSCLYLSSDLTILRMYELYQDQCGEDNLIPAHIGLLLIPKT